MQNINSYLNEQDGKAIACEKKIAFEAMIWNLERTKLKSLYWPQGKEYSCQRDEGDDYEWFVSLPLGLTNAYFHA